VYLKYLLNKIFFIKIKNYKIIILKEDLLILYIILIYVIIHNL